MFTNICQPGITILSLSTMAERRNGGVGMKKGSVLEALQSPVRVDATPEKLCLVKESAARLVTNLNTTHVNSR